MSSAADVPVTLEWLGRYLLGSVASPLLKTAEA